MTVSREGELPVRRRLPRTLAVLGAELYEPEPNRSACYDEGYHRYRQLFDAVEAIT